MRDTMNADESLENALDQLATTHHPLLDSNTALNRIEDKIKQLLAQDCQLQEYYRQDPTLIHFHQAWRNIQQDCMQIELELVALTTASNQDRCTALQQQIAAYLPETFIQELENIRQAHEQGQNSMLAMDRLAAHPYFLQACKIEPSLQTQYAKILNENQLRLTNALINHSRHLFLQFNEAEMLNSKTQECPNYKNITQFFNFTSAYVQHDLLQTDSCNAATAAMHRWIGIARELYRQGDFSSLRAVIAGLHHSAVQKTLKMSQHGLNGDDAEFLHTITQMFEDNSAVQAEIDKRHHEVIPYAGTYRTTLERAKAKNEQASRDLIVTELSAMQKAVLSKHASTHSVNPLATWIETEIPSGDYLKFENGLYERAKIHPSKAEIKLASSLCHFNQHCWLSHLRNPLLVEYLLKQKITFSPDTTLKNFERINAAFREKMTDQEFLQTLRDANLNVELSEPELRRINHYNRQAYYHHLIENKVLAELIDNLDIHDGNFGHSTTETILRLNKHLRQGINTQELNQDLQRINIHLSHQQREKVLKCSEQERKKAKLPELENLLEQTQIVMQELNLCRFFGSETQTQLNDYLLLIKNSDDLDAIDKQELLDELRNPCLNKGMGRPVDNPWLTKLSLLQRNRTLLLEMQTNLTENRYDQKISDKIDSLLTTLSASHYQNALRDFDLIQGWCAANGEPGSVFKEKVAAEAKSYSILQRAFHTIEDLATATLTQVKQRTGRTTQVEAFCNLRTMLHSELKPAMQAFKTATFDPSVTQLLPEDLKSLKNDIQEATTYEECAKLKAFLARNVPLQKFLTLESCYQKVNEEFYLWTRAQHYRGFTIKLGAQRDRLTIRQANQLHAMNFREQHNEARTLFLATATSDVTAENLPGINQTSIAVLHELKKLNEKLQSKMAEMPIPEGYQETSITEIDVLATVKNKPHLQKVVTWSGAAIAAVAFGAVAAHVIGVATTAIAVKLLIAKIITGTAAGAVGGGATQRMLSRFHLFGRGQSPTETPSAMPTATIK